MDIYLISGSVWLSDVPLTSSCEAVQELMKEDYVQIVWNSASNAVIPVGAYILLGGERYSLLEPYTPEQRTEAEWVYKPKFQSAYRSLSKVPFFMYTTVGSTTTKEAEWTLTDNPANFMAVLCDAIYAETGIKYDHAVGIDVVVASATCDFNCSDIQSAISQIAGAFETEIWLEKYAQADGNGYIGKLHMGKAQYGTAVELEVGVNVKVPSVTKNGEYFNRFYVFGSARNITQDYQGANVNNIATKRLTLSATDYPGGYMDFSNGGQVFSKVLVFEDIYPSATDLVVMNIRSWLRYRRDESTSEKVQIGTDPVTGDPIYDMYAVWFVNLKRKVGGSYVDFTFNNTTYDKEDNPTGMLLPGLVPSLHFNSGPLAGREFEVIYHDTAETVKDGTDGSTFSIQAGDFEIKFIEEGTYIIPAVTGLIPQTDNLVVLFNVMMPASYVDDAEDRLETAALEEINKNYLDTETLVPVDRNSYQVESDPTVFSESDPGLTLGRKVNYVNGTYEKESRITRLVKKLAPSCYQTITIGDDIIKGSIEELKEEAVSANRNIDLLAALNKTTSELTAAYERTHQLILKQLSDQASMFLVIDGAVKLNPIYSGLWAEGWMSAGGVGSGGGGGGTTSYLNDLLDVNAPNPAAGDALTWDATSQNWVNSPLSFVSGSGYYSLTVGGVSAYLYTKAQVDNLIGSIEQFHYEIYASTSAVTNPQGNVLYLIGPTGSGADKYEEYVYANNTWTKIGDTSIDVSQFVTGLGVSGNYLTYTKGGVTYNVTVPYATVAGKVGTATVGSTELPVYINSGTPTVIQRLPARYIYDGFNFIGNGQYFVGFNPAFNFNAYAIQQGAECHFYLDDVELVRTNDSYAKSLFDGLSSCAAQPFDMSGQTTYTAYDSSHSYIVGELCSYTPSGATKVMWYRCKVACSGVAPTDTTYWEDVSASGNYAGVDPMKFTSFKIVVKNLPNQISYENGITLYWRTQYQHPDYVSVRKINTNNEYFSVVENHKLEGAAHCVYLGTGGSTGTQTGIELTFTGFTAHTYWAFALSQIAFTGMRGSLEGAVLFRGGGTMFGNITPYTNNGCSLGDSSHRWYGLYAYTGNFSGAVTVSSTLSVGGAITLSGSSASARRIYFGDSTHYLELDSHGFHFSHGVYSEGFMAAGGIGSGGGGGGSVTYLNDLSDVTAPNPGNGDLLTWDASVNNNQGAWVNVARNQVGTPVSLTNGATYSTLTVNSVTADFYTKNQTDSLLANIDLSAYVTQTALSTTLASYVTNSALTTTLASYATKAELDAVNTLDDITTTQNGVLVFEWANGDTINVDLNHEHSNYVTVSTTINGVDLSQSRNFYTLGTPIAGAKANGVLYQVDAISNNASTVSANNDTTRIVWDSNAGAWHIKGNLYADGWIAAGGIGQQGGGGGGVSSFYDLPEIGIDSSTTILTNQVLTYNGTAWVNQTLGVSVSNTIPDGTTGYTRVATITINGTSVNINAPADGGGGGGGVETDPVFSASAAYGISSNDISAWNSKLSGVMMNGSTVTPTNGVVNLGTVLTAVPDLSSTYVTLAGAQTITGAKTFTSNLSVNAAVSVNGISTIEQNTTDHLALFNYGGRLTSTLNAYGTTINLRVFNASEQANILSVQTDRVLVGSQLLPNYQTGINLGGSYENQRWSTIYGLNANLTGNLVMSSTSYIDLGPVRIEYDSVNKAIHVKKADSNDSNEYGFYCDGFVAAGGVQQVSS